MKRRSRCCLLGLIFFILQAWTIAAQANDGLDPLLLGVFGFRSLSGEWLAAVSGLDFRGKPSSSETAPFRPALVCFFSASYASSASTLKALEGLRKAHKGRLGVFALSPDPPSRVGACLGGLPFEAPLYSSSTCAASLGLSAPQAFALVSPGGAIVALRDGAFDWSSQDGAILLDLFLKAYPAKGLASPGPATDSGRAMPDYLTDLEAEILDELDTARSDPRAYADFLRDYLTHVSGSLAEYPGEEAVRLVEGKAAIEEAVAFLSRQPRLPFPSAFAGAMPSRPRSCRGPRPQRRDGRHDK